MLSRLVSANALQDKTRHGAGPLGAPPRLSLTMPPRPIFTRDAKTVSRWLERRVCFWTKARPVCRGHVPHHVTPPPFCRPFSLTAETDG
jgi:hypothetical protein